MIRRVAPGERLIDARELRDVAVAVSSKITASMDPTAATQRELSRYCHGRKIGLHLGDDADQRVESDAENRGKEDPKLGTRVVQQFG